MAGIRRVTTRHHGRDVVWNESSIKIAASVDGVSITIQKQDRTTYQPSRGGRLADPAGARYRLLVDGSFAQPGWGYRRSLREAKNDGVELAIKLAAEAAAGRAAARAATASRP